MEQVVLNRVFDRKIFEIKKVVGHWHPAEGIMEEIEKDKIFYLESGGGVTFSGGEPLMQVSALEELLSLCKKRGYHTAIDTSGHAEPAGINRVMDLADLWLFDLKIMDDLRHVEFTGVSNEMALYNLQKLARAHKDIIIRFPLIPGINDSVNNLEEIGKLMNSLNLGRLDILPYHDIAREKYKRFGRQYVLKDVKEPDETLIGHVKDFFQGLGIDVMS